MKDRCVICECWFNVKDMQTDGAERYCQTCWEEYLPEILGYTYRDNRD